MTLSPKCRHFDTLPTPCRHLFDTPVLALFAYCYNNNSIIFSIADTFKKKSALFKKKYFLYIGVGNDIYKNL